MIALPTGRMSMPLTAAAYAALPEDSEFGFELQEGALVMTPRPAPEHQGCMGQLLIHLDACSPQHLKVLVDVDVDLKLVASDRPGTVRAPDLIVVNRASYERTWAEGGLLPAADVVLAVEILSPSSRRTDSTIKHDEYSDAGIPHYWIVDVDGRTTLTACHLAGEFGYVDAAPVTGRFTTADPFPITLDLDKLV